MESEGKKIATKEEFIELCLNTIIPDDIMNTLDGLDFLMFMNEYRRIVENTELTNVKTYSYRLQAPNLWNYYVGYFADIHNARLKVNRNWLKAAKDEDWWKERIVAIMRKTAEWVKRILYMNDYEEREHDLARMRKALEEKGLDWS